MYKLGMAQFSPVKGNDAFNLDRIAKGIHQASQAAVDLLVFPESAVTGYVLEAGVDSHALGPDTLAEEIAKRVSVSNPIEVVIGFYEKSDSRPFNSAAHLLVNPSGVAVKGVYRKFFPPTYGVFDEQRYHGAGHQLGILETRVGKVGVLICEDVWHSILRSLLVLHGCHTIVVPAASPARGFKESKPGNLLRYERMLTSCSEENGVYSALACLTGSEGGKLLAGGSMIIDPFGEKLVEASPFGEELIVATIDPQEVHRAQLQTPLLQDMRQRLPDLVRLLSETANS